MVEVLVGFSPIHEAYSVTLNISMKHLNQPCEDIEGGDVERACKSVGRA